MKEEYIEKKKNFRCFSIILKLIYVILRIGYYHIEDEGSKISFFKEHCFMTNKEKMKIILPFVVLAIFVPIIVKMSQM